MRAKLGAMLMVGTIAMAVPVAAQVKDGGPRSDRLRGTAKGDELFGRGGADTLLGRGGRDKLRGAAGADEIKGAKGRDRLLGGGAADVLIGGKGRDTLNPGKGEDGVNMRDGVELAAPGRDVIRARDGSADQISCGEGNDRAFVDEFEDGVYNCEELIEP